MKPLVSRRHADDTPTHRQIFRKGAGHRSVLGPIADWVTNLVFYEAKLLGVAVPVIVVWLVTGAAFFTFYLGFKNIVGFKHAIDLVRGKYSKPE